MPDNNKVDKPEEAPLTEEAKQKKRYDAISEQHRDEFSVGEKFMQPWREAKRTFLKLYINQRKNPKKVGDTLMFSTHQTILAAPYKDRLDAEWIQREEEDEERTDGINALWEFDYDEMGKPEHDYDKFWDAAFYGIAIEDWSHFDRETLTPIADLWDLLTAVLDPKATKINGNRLGRGASRFVWRSIVRTKREMEDHGGYFNLKLLDASESELQEMKRNQDSRDEALTLGVDNIQRNFQPMVQAVELWRGHQITDVQAKTVIYEAFIEGGLEAPRHLARLTHDAYFEPPHEEFQPRTMWSLSNAFTHALKEPDPIPLQRATANLGDFLKRYN